MADRIQFRRDTEAEWADHNPILGAGEISIVTDTQQFKLGDGLTAWLDLPFSSATLKSDAEQFLALHDVTASEYDDNGVLQNITYDTGSKRIYTYDSGYLTKEEFTDADGSTVILTITYEYDDDDNLNKTTRS